MSINAISLSKNTELHKTAEEEVNKQNRDERIAYFRLSSNRISSDT